MAKRYYNLEKETKTFLKRMEETRGVLPDGAGIARINDYIVKRKGSGLFFSKRDKSCLNVNSASQQRISITSNNSLRVSPSWEMVVWIFPRTAGSLCEYIGKSTNSVSGRDFSLLRVNNNVTLESSNTVSYISTGAKSLTFNAWQFFNFGRDSSSGNLFLSKNLDTASTVAQSSQPSSTASFVIGDWADGGRRPSDASFDGVGRWGRVLTTDERNFIYNSGRGVSYLELLAYRPDILAGCVSYWQLNESSGIRYDWHGTNHMSPINNPLNSNIGIIEKFY
jgi:hypothetical protein